MFKTTLSGDTTIVDIFRSTDGMRLSLAVCPSSIQNSGSAIDFYQKVGESFGMYNILEDIMLTDKAAFHTRKAVVSN